MRVRGTAGVTRVENKERWKPTAVINNSVTLAVKLLPRLAQLRWCRDRPGLGALDVTPLITAPSNGPTTRDAKFWGRPLGHDPLSHRPSITVKCLYMLNTIRVELHLSDRRRRRHFLPCSLRCIISFIPSVLFVIFVPSPHTLCCVCLA